MSQTNQKQEHTKGVSCLGVILIACMLLLSAFTLSLNLLFRGENALPALFGHRYFKCQSAEMEPLVPEGALVILNDDASLSPLVNDVVLYRSTLGGYRVAQVSLVLPAASGDTANGSAPQYYLTTKTNAQPIAVPKSEILGICQQKSPELGSLVGFFTRTGGILLGLIAPSVVLLLYLVAVFIATHESADDMDDDEESDLAFVKSIQQKKKQLPNAQSGKAKPAVKHHPAKDALEQTDETDDADEADDDLLTTRAARATQQDEDAEARQDAEARLEEQEAARRAERIAAIRSHMETRRQTTTSEIPLYTTETQIRPIRPTSSFDALSKTTTVPRRRTSTEAPRTRVTAEPTAPVRSAASISPVASKTAPSPKPAAAKPATPKPVASKPAAPKQSASFEELMALLDQEEQKLNS